MSHDLLVIAPRRPTAEQLDAFLAAPNQALSADGPLRRDGHLLLSDGSGSHVELDGPGRMEGDDVPDAAMGAIGARGWLLQLSVKGAAQAAWPGELAAHLARVAGGVVYDPQADRVVWPEGFRPRDAATGVTRIDELALDWFTALPPDEPEQPRAFLATLRAFLPEALPRRYGAYEPLPHRLEETGDDGFVAAWLEQAEDWVPMLFWVARRPSFGGVVSMSTRRAQHEQPGRPQLHLSITFDGRPFQRDPVEAERLVRLFTAVARSLDCFYAAGSVRRNAILRRGHLDLDRQTEVDPVPHAPRWTGLPSGPTWLAWFGAPYASLVRPTLGDLVTVDGRALFLRLGRTPADADDLADRYPPLPARLLARRGTNAPRWMVRGRYTFAAGPPSDEAEEIPELRPGGGARPTGQR